MAKLNATYNIIDLNDNVFQGQDGRGIVSDTDYWLISDKDTGVTVDDENWSTSIPTPTDEKPYLWNKNEKVYTDNPTPIVTPPHIVGSKGEPGLPGAPGKPGQDGKDGQNGTLLEILPEDSVNDIVQYYDSKGITAISPPVYTFKVGIQNYKGVKGYSYFDIKGMRITYYTNDSGDGVQPIVPLFDLANPLDRSLNEITLVSNTTQETSTSEFYQYDTATKAMSIYFAYPLQDENSVEQDTEVKKKMDKISACILDEYGGTFKIETDVEMANSKGELEVYTITNFLKSDAAVKNSSLNFILKDSGLEAAIKDAGLVFDSTGLLIKNGNFTIVDKKNNIKLRYDKNKEELYINGEGEFSGDVYASSGYFKGSFNAQNGLINSLNVMNVLKAGEIYIARSPLQELINPYKYIVTLVDEQSEKTFISYDNFSYALKENDILYLDKNEYDKWVQVKSNPHFIPCIYKPTVEKNQIKGQYGYIILDSSWNCEAVQPQTGISWKPENTYEGIYSSNYEKGKKGFLLTPTGEIFANNIELGESAKIANKISMSGYNEEQTISTSIIYNPRYKDSNEKYVNEGKFLEVIKNNKTTFLVSDEGYVKIGDLHFDGTESSIVAKHDEEVVWSLTKDEAIFNNIIVQGTIKTATFEQGTIQSIGSKFIFKNARYVDNIVIGINDATISITSKNIDITKEFPIGNLLVITNSSTSKQRIYKVVDNQNNLIKINITNEEDSSFLAKADLVMNYGTLQDWIIGINASSAAMPGLNPNSLTISSIKNESGDLQTKNEIILGEIPANVVGNPEKTSGLFASNVFLTGSLTTRYESASSEYNYAGVNTLSGATFNRLGLDFADNSKIIMWAGAKDTSARAIQESYFQVTENGTLYAQKGLFEGSIITKAKISASSLETALITGNGTGKYALTIQDADKGILFSNNKNLPYLALSKTQLDVGVPLNILNSTQTFYRADGSAGTTITNDTISVENLNASNLNFENIRVKNIYNYNKNKIVAHIAMTDNLGISLETDTTVKQGLFFGEKGYLSFVKNGDNYDIYVDNIDTAIREVQLNA